MRFLYALILFFLLGMVLPVQAAVVEVNNTELRELVSRNVPIVDIRRAEEWMQTGIVKGSHMLTFFDAKGNYDARGWLAQLATIVGKEEPFILICRTGRRTGLVSKFLDQQVGFKQVYNVTKGIRFWIDKGNPTVAP